jgi:hypothetical protein
MAYCQAGTDISTALQEAAAALTRVASIMEGSSQDNGQLKQRILALRGAACALPQPPPQLGPVPAQHCATLANHVLCVMRAVVRVGSVLLLNELHVAQHLCTGQLGEAPVDAQADVPRVHLVRDGATQPAHKRSSLQAEDRTHFQPQTQCIDL